MKCQSRKSQFGRCDLEAHEGTTHAVLIGGVQWFHYVTIKGKTKPLGYRPGPPDDVTYK